MLPVVRIVEKPSPHDPAAWPYHLPCVRHVLSEGLELGALTILVGENGAGKSTLVEAIAMAYGLNAEGGSTHARHTTQPTESPLWKSLRLERAIGANRWGFFLRAETMHGFYTYLADNPGKDVKLHELSHGESFIELLRTRFNGPGLYVLDEPESALSFTGCLALVGLLSDLAATGTAQVIVATHSPIIAATPGAAILEVSDAGLQPASWGDLNLVRCWRQFLDMPASFLSQLSATGPDGQ
jgi:predicted ATPase